MLLQDKQGSIAAFETFHPNAFLRRQKAGITVDSTDYPLSETYLSALSQVSDSVLQISRWLNAVYLSCASCTKEEIEKLSFVRSVYRIHDRNESEPATTARKKIRKREQELQTILKYQISRMQGQLFRENQLTGKGIRIAVFDAGFYNCEKTKALQHLFQNQQIDSTFDFVRNKESVFLHSNHGTKVLSCIAGKSEFGWMGMAPDAAFLLARTEGERFETFQEEMNWLAAAEWADRLGADLINSSLGYTRHRYFEEQMDGKTSLIVKAANLAVSKGMLVISSAGNEGNTPWKRLTTPGDGDSVFTVGASNPFTDLAAEYSSRGPSTDFRQKPNVIAPGTNVVAGTNRLRAEDGTSFSTGLITGFAACVLQQNKQYTPMELFSALEQSAHLYPYSDYANGYGIPQASRFLNPKPEPKSETWIVEQTEDTIQIQITEPKSPENFYFQVRKGKQILYYETRQIKKSWKIRYDKRNFPTGVQIRMHYEGKTIEIQL